MGKLLGKTKPGSLDEILDKYKELPAQDPSHDAKLPASAKDPWFSVKGVEMGSADGYFDTFQWRKVVDKIWAASGFPPNNPDLMDEELYKKKKEELIKSSRLYEPSQETSIETNDWED